MAQHASVVVGWFSLAGSVVEVNAASMQEIAKNLRKCARRLPPPQQRKLEAAGWTKLGITTASKPTAPVETLAMPSSRTSGNASSLLKSKISRALNVGWKYWRSPANVSRTQTSQNTNQRPTRGMSDTSGRRMWPKAIEHSGRYRR